MKKLLLCICALLVMPIQATESAGATGRIERKVEAAKAEGRKIDKAATDELFALVQATDEKHPIDLNQVQQLIDEGADVNALQYLARRGESFLLLETALKQGIFVPEFYEAIINATGYDKSTLPRVITDVEERIRYEEDYYLGYKNKNDREFLRRSQVAYKNFSNARKRIPGYIKIRAVLQNALDDRIAPIKQRPIDVDATYELYDLIYARPDNQNIDLGQVKQLLARGAAVNDEVLSETPIRAALGENLAIPELYKIFVETPEYDPTVAYAARGTAVDDVNVLIEYNQNIIARGYTRGQARAQALRNQEKWQEIKRILEDALAKYNVEQKRKESEHYTFLGLKKRLNEEQALLQQKQQELAAVQKQVQALQAEHARLQQEYNDLQSVANALNVQ